MEYLIMAYGRDFEPMLEIYCDSYMNLELYAMATCWPNVHCTLGKIILSPSKIHFQNFVRFSHDWLSHDMSSQDMSTQDRSS